MPAERMVRTAVFGYGSLVDPGSVAATLGRDPAPPLPANLGGWRRSWTLYRDNLRSEKTFARDPGGELPPFMLGLNLEPETGSAEPPNGALLELDDTELERLDLREMRYDRIEVTEQVSPEAAFERVFTYLAKPAHYAPQPPEGAVVIATYLRTIEAAFNALGPGQWERFLRTTGPPPVELIEAVLVEDRIPPGNPRAW